MGSRHSQLSLTERHQIRHNMKDVIVHAWAGDQLLRLAVPSLEQTQPMQLAKIHWAAQLLSTAKGLLGHPDPAD